MVDKDVTEMQSFTQHWQYHADPEGCRPWHPTG